MKLLIIIAAVVVYTSASPMRELLHPSPVNPDVLVAIKPEEKIILITDPKEIEKFKTETSQPFYPTVLPKANEHHMTKRDHSIPHETHFQVDAHKEIENKNSQNEHKHSDNMKVLSVQEPQALLLREPTPSKEQHKCDISVPLMPKHQHAEESSKERSEIESDAENFKIKTVLEHQPRKRDIPVPLVAKYYHPEESPKDSSEQQSHEHVSSEKHQEEISKESQEETHVFLKEANETLLSEHEPAKDDNFSSDKLTISQEKLPTNSTISVSYRDLHLEGNKNETEVKSDINENASSPNQKPNIQNDNLNASHSVKSPGEHILARPHPVPVAELFAKYDNNQD